MEELLEDEKALIYTREVWAGKIDKPHKEMFKLAIKRKLGTLFLTRLNQMVLACILKKENLDYVQEFYSNISSKEIFRSDQICKTLCLGMPRTHREEGTLHHPAMQQP